MHEQQQSQSGLTPEEQAMLNSRQASANGNGKGRQRKTSSRITPVDRGEIERRTDAATSSFRELVKGELSDLSSAVHSLQTNTEEAIATAKTAALNIVQEMPMNFAEQLAAEAKEVLSQRNSKSLDLGGLWDDVGFELPAVGSTPSRG